MTELRLELNVSDRAVVDYLTEFEDSMRVQKP